jgi:hypothetical protein
MFLDNPTLDNNFALACSMLTGSILGYPILEDFSRDMLLAWLEGDRMVKLSQLRSLAEVVRLSRSSGLFIVVDDLEILISRFGLEQVHYTKMKREDTYESIRQLIDDIDSMKHIMFVYGFDREQ